MSDLLSQADIVEYFEKRRDMYMPSDMSLEDFAEAMIVTAYVRLQMSKLDEDEARIMMCEHELRLGLGAIMLAHGADLKRAARSFQRIHEHAETHADTIIDRLTYGAAPPPPYMAEILTALLQHGLKP